LYSCKVLVSGKF